MSEDDTTWQDLTQNPAMLAGAVLGLLVAGNRLEANQKDLEWRNWIRGSIRHLVKHIERRSMADPMYAAGALGAYNAAIESGPKHTTAKLLAQAIRRSLNEAR